MRNKELKRARYGADEAAPLVTPQPLLGLVLGRNIVSLLLLPQTFMPHAASMAHGTATAHPSHASSRVQTERLLILDDGPDLFVRQLA